MAVEVVMPNLGFDAQVGRLVEWLKHPGDQVNKGDVIAIVESDKANVELESLASGILLENLFEADTEIPVGAIIARIGAAGEKTSTPAPTIAAPSSSQSAAPVEISPIAKRIAQENKIDLGQVQGSGPRGRIVREDVVALLETKPPNGSQGILALPKVRKAARDAGLELATIPGTGSQGQITLADLENYQRQPAPVVTEAPAIPIQVTRPGVLEIPMNRVRQVIGERLSQSKRDAPHFYVTGEFDVESAISALKALPNPQPRINDLLQYLTVQAVLNVPELNATYENGRLFQHEAVNLAMAIARENGLITPVLEGADRFSLRGLAQESRALIQRAQEDRLKPSDLQNGTFTISNLGIVKQVDHFTAVINPPQVAILAVGTVKPRPVVVNGGLHVRHTVHLTLSGDHRVVDGMHLARFMATFQKQLEAFVLAQERN